MADLTGVERTLSMRRRQIVDYLVYVAVRVLICVVQAMPVETGRRLAHLLARLFCDMLHVRSRVVDDNLAHAFPEMSPAERTRSGPADVGTSVLAGVGSRPHAAEDPRDELARLRCADATRPNWCAICSTIVPC